MNFYANILESKQPVLGDPYFYQTKEEIENWLKKMGIENYKINDDLTVDVNGWVDLAFKYLKKIPIKFGKISGGFSVGHNQLTSLKGCPETVGGYFHCGSNKFTSLEYCPDKIGGDFSCAFGKLTSLKHFPSSVGGVFSLAYNPVKTLEGLQNVTMKLLSSIALNFPKLDWKEIEWNKVKNLDEITTELYENIEKGKYVDGSKEVLKRIEELQLY